MAVLHRKEEKIQAVLGRLPKTYTDEQFVAMFIKLYSKDWGKIKSAYIKQAQDREPGTVINMPKPELYLKQVTESYLKQQAALGATATPVAEVVVEAVIETAKKPKASSKKAVTAQTAPVIAKEEKPAAKAKTVTADETLVPKKPRASTKKVAATADEPLVAKKEKPAAKAKATANDEILAPKKPRASAKKVAATADEPIGAKKEKPATKAKASAIK